MTTFTPSTSAEVLSAVQWALSENAPLEILGAGTKRGIGRPVQAAHTLDLSHLTGVTLYEPEELVLTAKAGTPLAEIEKMLAERNQQFAFEPIDYGPLLGQAPGRATIGGVLAANLSGPRRLKAGAARDHILGIQAVSGRGEAFKSGGRVVKNVTGYDLSKLMAGSWGTLAVVTDLTFKVLPAAETETTLALRGLADEDAVEAMALAMGSSAEVSGAAHLPQGVADRVAGGALGERCDDAAARRRFWAVGRLPDLASQGSVEGGRSIDEIDDRPVSRRLARRARLHRLCGCAGKAGLARFDATLQGPQDGLCAAHGGGRRGLLRLAGRADLAAHRRRAGGRTPCAGWSPAMAAAMRRWCALRRPTAPRSRHSSRSRQPLPHSRRG